MMWIMFAAVMLAAMAVAGAFTVVLNECERIDAAYGEGSD